MKRTRATKAALALGSMVAVSLGAVGPAVAAPPEMVTICHGTASETNPYVVVTVSATSFKDGHFDEVVNKSHGENNHPDFVLVEGRTCADGPGGGDGGGDGGGGGDL